MMIVEIIMNPPTAINSAIPSFNPTTTSKSFMGITLPWRIKNGNAKKPKLAMTSVSTFSEICFDS